MKSKLRHWLCLKLGLCFCFLSLCRCWHHERESFWAGSRRGAGATDGEKVRINIECIECCGKHLYLGTNDCFIHHFLLEEHTTAKGKLAYNAQKLLHKYLGLKKPVAELKAASALERLIVLCDSTITVVDMVTLEPVPTGGTKLKGVTAFCINENPVTGDAFCVEMAVVLARRRAVQICTVHEDRVQMLKEVTTPEQPCALPRRIQYLSSPVHAVYRFSTTAQEPLRICSLTTVKKGNPLWRGLAGKSFSWLLQAGLVS